MKSNRPKINVPVEPMDIILDLLSVAIISGTLVYAFISYADLPEIIPSHFNASGEVDGYSEKYMIWLVPVISAVIFIGLFIMNKYPHLHNYMVNITEENALKHYRFSTRIIRFTNLFVTLIFGVILYAMVQSAHGNSLKIGSWFIPAVLGFSVVLPIVIFVYQKKNLGK